jgi:hypothetical protein
MNHRERLHWLIAELRTRTHPLTVENVPPEDMGLLEVTAGLLRCCIEAAEAADTLLTTGRYEGLFPIERAAWEIWNEFEFARAESVIGLLDFRPIGVGYRPGVPPSQSVESAARERQTYLRDSPTASH